MDDAVADASSMVLALQGVQRMLASVQLAHAAAASSAASADDVDPSVGHSFELQFNLFQSDHRKWLTHPRVWHAMGQLPCLQKLQLAADSSDVLVPPSSIGHVSALAGLASSLHTLEIIPMLDQQQPRRVVDYSGLSSLSRLTCLTLPLSVQRQGFSSIGACFQLQDLHLAYESGASAAPSVTLQPDELCAMCQLTQLTHLGLYGAVCEGRAGWNFLSSLRQLQELAVDSCLPHTVVAALACLTCLSELTCGWEQQQGALQATARCAAVRDLHVLEGVPPLCAFPGLTSLTHKMPWEPAVLNSAAKCCTQLEFLAVIENFGGHLVCELGSLLVSAPAAVRTAAVISLAALQKLQELSFSVNDNPEVAAVSALRHVKRLYLMVHQGSSCSVQGLAALAAMQQLQLLTIELLNVSKSSVQEADVQVLLSAVRHVSSVEILVQNQHLKEVKAVVRRAEKALAGQGLQLASKVAVAVISQE
jgi:hypothetical protein